MKRLKLLTKYFLRNALEETFGKSKINTWLIVLAMMAVIGLISAFIASGVALLYKPLEAVSQEGYLLSMLLFLGATVTFIFGINTIMNNFYFSNDVEQILPLPFKGSQIIFGKFLSVLIDMYLYAGVLVLPLITYGVLSKAGVAYYIYAILALLITPILPMILVAFICMVLMRFTNLSKHKDAFKMLSGTLMIAFYVGFNIFSQSRSGGSEESMVNLMSSGNNSLMDSITNTLITSKFAAYGLLYSNETKGLLYILAALVISIAAFIIFYIIGGNLYYKGIIGSSESYSKRENIFKRKDTNKIVKTSSPIKALVVRDIKVIFRTPQFFINCVVMILYMPLIMGMGLFTSGADIGAKLSESTDYYGFALIAAFGFSAIAISSGCAASTAVSREGKDFMVSRYIPISPKDQLKSKIISSVLINEIGFVLVIGSMIALGAPLGLIIVGSIVSIGSIFAISLIELYMDFKSPRLEWETEKAMFKKNYLPIIMFLVVSVIAGILCLITFLIKNYLIIFGVILILIALVSFIIYPKLQKVADKTYNEG
jgi:ABC-2 type transport system permease protein